MLAKEIVSLLDAKTVALSNEAWLEKDYRAVFASDLMSDALAMIQEAPEDTVLITGLANNQILRTAEMLDLQMIVIVRGKKLNDEAFVEAKDMGFNIFRTKHTMYTACGILYEHGLRGIDD